MYRAYIDLLERAHDVDVADARARTKKANISGRSENEVFSMDDRQFIKKYRLSKESALQLIEDLTPHMPPILRSDAVDVETKVLVALAFYATGSYQTIVGDHRKHCTSQASVSKAVQQVTVALNKPEIMNKFISFPFRQHEREGIKREFYNKFKMPGLLGCIDGTQVAIVCPTQNEERFYNRKGYHSLNVLILCDASLNILCVDPSYPGSTHDSVVWANHVLNPYLEKLHTISGENLYLLGDSGYPLRPTLMIPVSDPEPNTPEHHYQSLHLSTRNTVERCIGVLKARFRCLLVDRKLHYAPVVAAKIINACCVLHNIAHRANTPYSPLTAEEAARERSLTEGTAAPRPRHAFSELEMGRARRQALISTLWANRLIEN